MLLGEKLSHGLVKLWLRFCRLLIVLISKITTSHGKTQGTMLLGKELSRGPAKTRLWSCRLLIVLTI